MSLCYEYFDRSLMRNEVIQSICIPKMKFKPNSFKVFSAYDFVCFFKQLEEQD